MNRIMIAGTSSWVGKTTISAGIMAAFTRRGKKVAPFKVGPDYIDPGFHRFVTKSPSCNLDSWLLSEDTLRYLFNRHIKDSDIAVIEGVMGFYDGLGIEKDKGSSAHVSKILKTPVILIINGKGISSSAAAQVLGYKLYDREVDIKGVIVNRVSGEGHYNLIKEAIERDTSITCAGYLPGNLDISLDSRHLGLIPVDEVIHLEKKVNTLADMVEKYIDLDLLEDISSKVLPPEDASDPCEKLKNTGTGLKIGIAMDKAFTFYYEDNLRLMKQAGIELIPFSPLNDKFLPSADGLYIGGGFPEIFADKLEENVIFRKTLKNALEEGLPAYCECGGLMYLSESIENLEGKTFEMAGFFPVKSLMTKKLQRFGYVEIIVDDKINIRGHEFHHSTITDSADVTYRYRVRKIRDGVLQKEWQCGLSMRNVLAGYGHIHFYSNPEFLMNFIQLCKKFSKNSDVSS